MNKDGASNQNGQAGEFRPPPCAISHPRKVVLSASVAARLLKTKTVPVYPADVQVSGTAVVVLQGEIGIEGRVEALRVISGPVMLQQAALEAARQWTYRPYRLNNMAVKFETTINVEVPAPH